MRQIHLTINRIAPPLQNGWQHATMGVALPTNAEGRNGQFRDGGHYQTGWLDAHQAHAAQQSRVSLCLASARREEDRAVCGASQQSRGNVFRTVQNATPRQNSEVVSASNTRAIQLPGRKPRCVPRRSLVSRHAYCMPSGNIRQGRVEGVVSMQVSTLYVLLYFSRLAADALRDRHYRQWQEGRP